MYDIFTTCDVSKEFILIVIKALQFLNIELISSTSSVLNELRSIFLRIIQLLNIEFIFLTFFVTKPPGNLILVKE